MRHHETHCRVSPMRLNSNANLDMGLFVYALCAMTSLLCCLMLALQHRRSPAPLLRQSAIAFFCFGISNILLFIDLIMLPQVDLRIYRNLASLTGVAILLVALIDHQGKTQR